MPGVTLSARDTLGGKLTQPLSRKKAREEDGVKTVVTDIISNYK